LGFKGLDTCKYKAQAGTKGRKKDYLDVIVADYFRGDYPQTIEITCITTL